MFVLETFTLEIVMFDFLNTTSLPTWGNVFGKAPTPSGSAFVNTVFEPVALLASKFEADNVAVILVEEAAPPEIVFKSALTVNTLFESFEITKSEVNVLNSATQMNLEKLDQKLSLLHHKDTNM